MQIQDGDIADPASWSRAESISGPPPPDEVALWAIDLDERAAGASILAPAERARADAFRFEADRSRFLAGRTARRLILAGATGLKPEDLDFAEQNGARPRLAHGPGAVEFSYSKSESYGLFAIAGQGPVGVDLEAIADTGDLELVVETHFAPSERRHLAGLAGEAWLEAFYRIWTTKEAALKASGAGLSGDLSGLEVDIAAFNAARPASRAKGALNFSSAQSDTDATFGFKAYSFRLAIGAHERGRRPALACIVCAPGIEAIRTYFFQPGGSD